MNRRELLLSSGIMATSGGVALATEPGAQEQEKRNPSAGSAGCYVVAQTGSGQVRGIDVAGVKQFLGIPYGGTTGGRNRFLPPTKVKPWTGVRDTYGYGNICPQPLTDPKHPFGLLIDWDQQPGAHSEDCLNLNVWTPGLRDGRKRPVLVYFHGGGYNTGCANYPYFIGDRLARFGDAVVITVNHRLGAFGYLNLADLGAPAEFAHAANAGMLDLVQALQWVRDNGESFGGDPGRVMIFGQSGGGYKVSTMLAMPAAKGLFHRAAQQSGCAIRCQPREVAAQGAARLMTHLGLRKGDFRKLQQLPFEQLIGAQMALGCFDYIKASGVMTPDAPSYVPVADGVTVPRNPFDPVAPEFSAHVPVMLGYCRHDAGWAYANFDLDYAGLNRIVSTWAGEKNLKRVLDAYLQSYPNTSPFLLQALMLTDRKLVREITTEADLKSAQGAAGVWVYRFDWPSAAFGGAFGAVHAMDSGLVFRNNHQALVGGDTPESRAVADLMATAFISFARNGTPGSGELAGWSPYSAQQRTTMLLDRPYSRVATDPNGSFRKLWSEIDGHLESGADA